MNPLERTDTILARVAGAMLVALAVVLPFEVPVLRVPVGGLVLTSVEVVLYATLFVWGLVEAEALFSSGDGVGAVRGAARRWARDPLALVATAWVLTLFVSASFADTSRGPALKFSLRSLSGVFLFFAARRLAARRALARRVVFGLVAGALASALAGVVESVAPSTARIWRAFREHDFEASGLRRASGAFAYPTIAAMYWEAVAPLAVVVTFTSRARRWTRDVPLLGASSLLVGAILASATRSSLAGAAIALGALALLTRARAPEVARRSLVASAAMLITAGFVLAFPGEESRLGQRLRFWRDDAWFGVRYEVPEEVVHARAGSVFRTDVTLTNVGTVTWKVDGDRPTRLANHWYRADEGPGPGALVVWDGMRTALAEDVEPGGSLRLDALARAPTQPGHYVLAWDLVEEGVTWFSERGSAARDVRVEVTPAAEASSPEPLRLAKRAEPPPPAPPRLVLWRAALTLFARRPILGIGPDNFRRRYEAVAPPSPNGRPYADERIHANSLYFETLADLGLAGAAVLVALALAVARGVRSAVDAGDALGVGLGVSVATFYVHGVSDYFLEFTPAFGLFWLLLGLLAAASEHRTSARRAPPHAW